MSIKAFLRHFQFPLFNVVDNENFSFLKVTIMLHSLNTLPYNNKRRENKKNVKEICSTFKCYVMEWDISYKIFFDLDHVR